MSNEWVSKVLLQTQAKTMGNVNQEKNMHNARANAIAMAAVEQLPTESTSLIQYSSRGRVAVIGGIEAQEFCQAI